MLFLELAMARIFLLLTNLVYGSILAVAGNLPAKAKMESEMSEDKVFVNTLMEPELVEKLDEMVNDHGSSRAQFIRLLVRQKYDEFSHLKNIETKVVPKIKQVAKS